MINTRQILVTIPLMGVVALGFYGVILLPNESRNKSCQSNLKQIGLGLKQYGRDYDEQTVLVGNWKKAVSPWLKNDTLLDCPSVNSYAFNRYMSGASLSFEQFGSYQNYASFPTVFDSLSTQPNAADFGTSYVASGAHEIWRRGRGSNVLFFDGHVKSLQQKPVFRALQSLAPPKLPNKAAKTREAR